MKHTILFAAMLCVAMTATANNAKISGRIKDANDKSAIILADAGHGADSRNHNRQQRQIHH